ncbi:phospholipid carrier-dependent glycosyltransferase [candidate division WWE3 bacterium]|jgi:4-amino-4-deoxy-L-arabinose transferase-like glycosyltransferase|nr:phospholipid carrier-dependent glycosyltransferase [candidate division WWE3 bacterium]MBT7349454.1 phospholipid carrier-dependent glycosyltransferase [candidate division WWE3 bacterium]
MPIVELSILILIFFLSLWLIKRDFNASLTLLLVLSVLLHKEFFSIYQWDLVPVRIFMLAFAVDAALQVVAFFKKGVQKEKIIQFFSEPFILLLTFYWMVNGLSLFFTENLRASILFYAFQTTIMILGVVLFTRLRDDTERIKSLIWTYIYIALGLTIFGFIQLGVYTSTGFIFGALWNVHGRLPRIGATFWDVNHFAALLASTLPVLGMFTLAAKTWKKRAHHLAVLIPIASMLFITNSRSAWILAGVALLTFAIVLLIRKWGMKGIYGLILSLVLVSGLGVLEYNDKASPFRKVIKDYFHYRMDSFDAHMLLLEGSWQVFEKFPFLGGGTGGFFEQFAETDIAPTFFGRDPIFLISGFRAPGHSIWGETLAETGALGMFSFLMLISLILFTLLYAALTEKDNERFLLSAGMFSSLVGWLTAAIFYSYKSEYFWLIFFLYFLYGVSILGKKFNLNNIYSRFLKSNKFPYIAIALIGAAVIFSGLGNNHFIPWDEAIYSKIAKNMVNSGDFTVLRWNPESVWFEKPPLYIWMAAISMKLFGITEFAGRLPSALLGFSTLFIVYQLSKRMFNKTTAFIAALTLATTTQFIYYSRASMMDVSVTFFMTLALMFYYKTFTGKDKLSNWVWVGVALGLGGMIKNVVGFLPLVVIGIHELILLASKERKLNKDLFKKYFALMGALLVVFMPWHIEMLRRFGKGFVDNYFIYHVLTRGTEAIEQKGRPFWWYMIILKVSMRIWFVALLAAFPFSVFQAFVKKNRTHIFLVVWSLVIFLFFSSAKSKLVWYIMPLYPVLSIIVGRFIERFYDLMSVKMKIFSKPLMKSFFIYSLTAFSLFYLFLVKDLVYTGDLTGAQATLLQRKDELFGLEIPVYVDKIELPLILYYTDGNFVDTDFRSLKNTLDVAVYDQSIVFVTKESRFESYAEKNEYRKLVEEMGDYVLARQESEYERDLNILDDLERELINLDKLLAKKRSKGDPIAVVELNEQGRLQSEVLQWQQEIDKKLTEPVAIP